MKLKPIHWRIIQLTPFIVTTIIFFCIVKFNLIHHDQIVSSVLKVIPIYCLAGFIYVQQLPLERIPAKWYLIVGLIFCSIGDILLNVDLFEYGMMAFLFGHFFYIYCFGFKPLRPIIGIVIYVIACLAIGIFFVNLSLVLKFGVPIYALALSTTCWRAMAQWSASTPSKLCAIGTVLFVISDAIIGIDMFVVGVSSWGELIMPTYYAAQFGISMHILDHRPVEMFVT